jgi:hypothetical protein
MSFTVTDKCCFTPGEYVVPDGNAIATVPVVEIPLWHELHVPSPGAPVLPAGGCGYAIISSGTASKINATIGQKPIRFIGFPPSRVTTCWLRVLA